MWRACIALLVIGGAWGREAPQSGHPDTSGWRDLFQPDLSNARLGPGQWVLENGILSAKSHENIWTRESYGDFVLDLEFKVAKGANSGVFLRAGMVGEVFSRPEVQIHETTDGTKYGMVGAVYDVKPPDRSMAKPAGSWNRFTITCRGSLIQVVFNGEQVISIDLNDWPEARKNPDGTENKYPVALKDFPRRGSIGLQGIHGREGQPVWFRHIKIKELN